VPTLAQEVAVLDEARRAVAGARGAEAMAVLDRYQRDFPRGRLGHEAALVRMQALIQQGNHAAAAQLAEQFLKANPNSPLAPRVRALTNR
jgi:outer membrane protein assembly factor BamD (BamD/ComL family)